MYIVEDARDAFPGRLRPTDPSYEVAFDGGFRSPHMAPVEISRLHFAFFTELLANILAWRILMLGIKESVQFQARNSNGTADSADVFDKVWIPLTSNETTVLKCLEDPCLSGLYRIKLYVGSVLPRLPIIRSQIKNARVLRRASNCSGLPSSRRARANQNEC